VVGDGPNGPPAVIEAGLWGFGAASSLIIGALLAFGFDLSNAKRGLILAFGAGTLLGAVAYELIEDSLADSERGVEVALGFALGAITFYAGSVLIDGMSGREKPGTSSDADGSTRSGGRRASRAKGLAVVLGAVLDGIPESVVLGLSLIGGAGIGVPVLVAVFVSNVPEALSASEDLTDAGESRGRIIGIWVIVALVSALASALGFVLLDNAPSFWVGLIQSFAAGAILAMLAESMFPEAYEIGGRPVGLATCVGFALAAHLSLRT
jgi:zinc transporter, ZIP family